MTINRYKFLTIKIILTIDC